MSFSMATLTNLTVASIEEHRKVRTVLIGIAYVIHQAIVIYTNLDHGGHRRLFLLQTLSFSSSHGVLDI